MDQQFGQSQWPNNPPVGGGSNLPTRQAGVPSPPPPPIGIRTMESDLSTIKESGGSAPEPKPFTPSEFKTQAPVTPQQPMETKLNVPGYTGPEEAVFSPQTLPGASNSSTTTAGVSVSVIADAARAGGKKWLKSALWGGGGIVVLAGLGLAGYYFVYPLIFPTVPSSPVPVVQPAQPATTTPGTATTTPQAVFEPHKSFFVIAAEKTEALKVTPTDTALSLRAALDGMSRDTAATGTIKEALATKEDGSPESFARVISLLIPELSEATLTTLFRGDFTLAFYFDQNGAWPVYVAQIQLGANLLDTQAALDGFEKSANLANLYPTNPGLQNPAGFKDGNASGKPMRYLSFTKQGASLNYGWIDNFLVIGASYDAVKDAIRRLGLGLRS